MVSTRNVDSNEVGRVFHNLSTRLVNLFGLTQYTKTGVNVKRFLEKNGRFYAQHKMVNGFYNYKNSSM